MNPEYTTFVSTAAILALLGTGIMFWEYISTRRTSSNRKIIDTTASLGVLFQGLLISALLKAFEFSVILLIFITVVWLIGVRCLHIQAVISRANRLGIASNDSVDT